MKNKKQDARPSAKFVSRLTTSIRRPRVLAVCVLALLVLLFLGTYLYQNNAAASALKTAKALDNKGQFSKAKQALNSISKTLVSSSTTKQIDTELQRNQQLSNTQPGASSSQKRSSPSQANQQQQTSGTNGASKTAGQTHSSGTQAAKPGVSTSSTGSTAAGTSSGTGSGSGSSVGSGTGPSTAPLTSLGVVSFSANASSATVSTCNINDSLTFSANGSGAVTVTWVLDSSKTTSETVNPDNFSFSAAGTQSDSFYFSGTQGLESGDSYRVLAVITSVSNPSVSVTAGPVTLNSCAGPPTLASEQGPAFMTSIVPGTPSVYQAQDGIFANECSVQVATPYSVNSSGTVEAIVLVSSSNAIGYTYYDKVGATGFSGPGSATDTSYFRLPHLSGGGSYTIKVKLVEVSSPSTVYAYTGSFSTACD